MKIRSGLIAAVFLAGGAALSASTLANTQVGVSNLSFYVEKDIDLTLSVLDTGGDLFNYDPTTGEAHFAVAALPEVIDGQAVYDEPFFCFEGGSPSVGLHATDANGHVIASNLHAGGNLEYLPLAGEITLSPASSSYCFYKNKLGSELGPLGLFGVPPVHEEEEEDPQALFSDRFEGGAKLSITYQKSWNVPFPETAEHEEALEYQIIVQNTGNTSANSLSFQEVFPSNSQVYEATLIETEWRCDSSPARCGSLSTDWSEGDLRFSGVTLASGETLRFNVRHKVIANVPGEGKIHLHAAAVDTGAGDNAPYATAEREIDIVSTSVAFMQQPDPETVFVSGQGLSPTIHVGIVDGHGQFVPNSGVPEIRLALFFEEPALAGLGDSTQGYDGIKTWCAPVDETGLASFDSGTSAECGTEPQCGPVLPGSGDFSGLPDRGRYYILATAVEETEDCSGNGIEGWNVEQSNYIIIEA